MEVDKKQVPKPPSTTSSVQLEDSPCPLGCIQKDKTLFTAHDKIHNLPGEFNIVRCCTCNLIRTNPRPTPLSMAFYYPDDYAPYIDTEVGEDTTEPKSKLRIALTSFIRLIFDSKERTIPSIKAGRLLEVGCASGSYLHHMAELGWKVSGIEFSSKAAKKAQRLGYEIHVGALEEAPLFSEKFDLIVGWMVLEHLHDPINALLKLHEMAGPNAWLVLSMPNANSLEFKFFKSNWYALHPPNHLYHYTPETLTNILEKAGWSVAKTFHQRNLNNLYRSLAYYLEEHGWRRTANVLRKFTFLGGIFYYLQFLVSRLFSIFGQTGRMTIWARPTNEASTIKYSSSIQKI